MPDINNDDFEVDMDKANSILYVIGKITSEMDEVKAVSQKQIDRAVMFQDNECKKMQGTIDFLTGRLHGYALNSGKRTVSLPNGKLKLIKRQDKFDVVDEEKEFAWITQNQLDSTLVRLKSELNKAEIKKYAKSTGEIPDGVEVTPQRDTFKAVSQ